MKRVMVIGGPGSGKSTLAKRLHVLTGLPLFHLDQLYWQPGWLAPPKDEWRQRLTALAAQDEWIMDGGYDSTFDLRMARAGTILWLDLPRRICFTRVLRRMVVHFGRVRSDVAPGCREGFDFAFLKWAWTFRKAHASKYRLALARHAAHADVDIFATGREADSFLARLRR